MSKLLPILLAIVLFAGCATTNTTNKVMPKDVMSEGEAKEKNVKVSADIVQRVRQADNLFIAGQYNEAEKIYQELLAGYSSKDGAFETAVLTNLCMCYLETGERGKLKHHVNKLKEMSKNLSYLSRETQMVLELSETLSNAEPTKKDQRIDSRLTKGINEAFKEVK